MTREQLPGPHLVRYGIAADQEFLLGNFAATYNQIVLNASIVAHSAPALSSFFMQKARQATFIIDPQTHAFQHDISLIESSGRRTQGEIKRSFKSLIDAYGEPLKEIVGERREAVVPDDFDREALVRGFCSRVLAFQSAAIAGRAKASDTRKYFDFLKEKGRLGAPDPCPTHLVAPYFFMTANTLQHWLSVNLRCAAASLEAANREARPLAVQIVFSRDILATRQLRDDMLRAYTDGKPPSLFLVWVDSFSEHDAGQYELAAFADVLRELGKRARVVNLYGGFFTVALMRCGLVPGLVGVAHGLEYGEERAVVPVGGGIPVAKFYYPCLHKRLSFRDALRAARVAGGMRSPDDFHRAVCGCTECRAVVRNDPESDFAQYGRTRPVSFLRRGQPVAMDYPLPETRRHSVRHYMWCKQKEYEAGATLEGAITELEDARKRYSRALGFDAVAHCVTWAEALRSLRP